MLDLEPNGKIAYKSLKLISPEWARKLKIPAEAPVFVSAMLKHKSKCSQCEIDYGPLVYQVGHVVTAHHYHNGGGGIYYYKSNPPIGHGSRWIALVEPIGHQGLLMSEIAAYHSERVLIKQIFARCDYHPEMENVHSLDNHSQGDPYQPLDQGIISGEPYTVLSPVCQVVQMPNYMRNPRFRFIARAGEIVFQPLE